MLDRWELFRNQAGVTFRLVLVTKARPASPAGKAREATAHVFSMDDEKAWPEPWPLADLLDGLREGLYVKVAGRRAQVIVNSQPSAKILTSKTAQAEHVANIDPSLLVQQQRWEIISPIVGDERVYWRSTRGKLVAERALAAHCSENTVNLSLRLYFKGGGTRDSLRGHYDKSGTRKEPSTVADPPRGRTPKDEAYEIFRWDEETRAKVLKEARRIVRKNSRATSSDIYTKLLSRFFCVVDSESLKEVRKLGDRPTRQQIYTLLEKNSVLEAKLRLKHGDDNFDNDVKPMTGSARGYANGIGQYYEIDATIVDVWICADEDRNIVIGKATLYLIIDVFSRLIVGFHLTLDKPSWMGAMEAMYSIVESKETLCARWGHTYKAAVWIAHGKWPAAFRGDRGSDVLSYGSDVVIEGTDTMFINTPPRKVPRKGSVEVSFKLIQMPLAANAGGHTPSSLIGKRQVDDYKGEATRTMSSVAQEIIGAIERNNERVHRSIKLPQEQIWKGILPIPIKIWEHDYNENTGALSTFDEDYLRFKLLPNEVVTITPDGVKFKGVDLLWEPEGTDQQNLLLRASAHGTFKRRATFDPRLVDVIYLHDPKDPTKWTTLHLVAEFSHCLGMSWKHYGHYQTDRRAQDRIAEQHNASVDVRHDDASIARETLARKATQKAVYEADGRSRTRGAVDARIKQQNAEHASAKTLKSTAAPIPAPKRSEPKWAAAPSGPGAAPQPSFKGKSATGKSSADNTGADTAAKASETPVIAKTSANAALLALLDDN